MLKIAGVKTESAFYKKYPTQEAFMKVHGKEFKKAQMGAEIEKAQFGGNYNLGQSPNFQTGDLSSGLNQTAPYRLNSPTPMIPEFNAYNPQGDQANTKMAKGIFEGAHSVADSPFDAKSNMPGAGQIIGAATGIMNAAGAFKEQRNKLKKAKQDLGVTDVQLEAARSTDVDANRQRSAEFSKQRDAMMQPMQGGQLASAEGTGSNILGMSKNGKK